MTALTSRVEGTEARLSSLTSFLEAQLPSSEKLVEQLELREGQARELKEVSWGQWVGAG